MRKDRHDEAKIFVNKPTWRTNFVSYVYLYSLHVSGSHMPIIRRIIVSMPHLVCVTMCRWPSGCRSICSYIPDGHLHRMKPSDMQEHMLLHTRRSSTQNVTVRYAGAYAPTYQTVIYTEFHRQVCRSICSYIPDGHLHRMTPSGMQEHMLLHTRRSSTQNDTVRYAGAYAPTYQTVIYTQ